MALIVFDCDGTLVDSQPLIARTMAAAFRDHDLEAPSATRTGRIVGMALEHGIEVLLPAGGPDPRDVAATYRRIYQRLVAEPGVIPRAFDGLVDLLAALDGGGTLLGVCTGRARRSLGPILAHNRIEDRFVTLQTGDLHPGKPHPAMLETALAEGGVAPTAALMIGDATFDMEMARNAGVAAIGVAWGAHEPAELIDSGARAVAEDVASLGGLIADWLAGGP